MFLVVLDMYSSESGSRCEQICGGGHQRPPVASETCPRTSPSTSSGISLNAASLPTLLRPWPLAGARLAFFVDGSGSASSAVWDRAGQRRARPGRICSRWRHQRKRTFVKVVVRLLIRAAFALGLARRRHWLVVLLAVVRVPGFRVRRLARRGTLVASHLVSRVSVRWGREERKRRPRGWSPPPCRASREGAGALRRVSQVRACYDSRSRVANPPTYNKIEGGRADPALHRRSGLLPLRSEARPTRCSAGSFNSAASAWCWTST